MELRKYPELDGLRFFAVSLVVIHHQFSDENLVLSWFNHYGKTGVHIFFALSGFIITHLLMKESNRGAIDLKKFWFRRLIRLWPLFYLSLFASSVFLFYLTRNNPEGWLLWKDRIWHYIFHWGNYSIAVYGRIHMTLTHYWSLAVEEHFYIFWPILLKLTYELGRKKLLFFSMLLLITVPYFFRVYHTGFEKDYGLFFTHSMIDLMAWGCMGALYFEKFPNLKMIESYLTQGLSIFLFSIGLFVMGKESLSLYLTELSYTFIGISTTLLILSFLKGENTFLKKGFSIPLLSKAGILSYSVYLFHFMTTYMLFGLVNKMGWNFSSNLTTLINFFLPYIPAYLAYLWIEKPLEKVKKKYG